MKRNGMKELKNSSLASKMWLAFGGLIAIGIAVMIAREAPAMRRELKLLRM